MVQEMTTPQLVREFARLKHPNVREYTRLDAVVAELRARGVLD